MKIRKNIFLKLSKWTTNHDMQSIVLKSDLHTKVLIILNVYSGSKELPKQVLTLWKVNLESAVFSRNLHILKDILFLDSLVEFELNKNVINIMLVVHRFKYCTTVF